MLNLSGGSTSLLKTRSMSKSRGGDTVCVVEAETIGASRVRIILELPPFPAETPRARVLRFQTWGSSRKTLLTESRC